MIEIRDPREAELRAEGQSALPPRRSGGRPSAPRASIWLPVIAKCVAAIAGAVLLAIIGAKAGAHAPPESREPPPPPAPSLIAASFVALPTIATESADAGQAEPPPEATEAGPALPNDSGILADGRVILNLASETELTKLPGIGRTRARAILALRQRLSKFRAVEDLLRVKGVGRKMLRRLRPSVVLDRPVQAGGGNPSVAPSSSATVHVAPGRATPKLDRRSPDAPDPDAP